MFATLAKCLLAEAGKACTDNIVVLGDSYSDTGNLFSITGGALPPALAYDSGRFTNGKVWIEYFADLMGLNQPTPHYDPSTSGTNYAIGAAASGSAINTGWTSILTGTLIGPLPAKGLLLQTQDFLSDNSSQCASETLFIIWIGAVDLLMLGETNFMNIIVNIETSIKNLISGGATQFIVLNLPQLAYSPAYADKGSSLFLSKSVPTGLRNDVTGFNKGLTDMLQRTDTSNDIVSITHVDIAPLFLEAALNPVKFGLDGDNVSSPTLSEADLHIRSKIVFKNAQNALWYDGVHPTTTFHEAVAKEVHSVVTSNKNTKENIQTEL